MKKCRIAFCLLIVFNLLAFFGSANAAILFDDEIPQVSPGAIQIDGDIDDWHILAIKPFVIDDGAAGDTTCNGYEDSTDIQAVYIVKDDKYLYWRMDMHGSYTFENNKNPNLVLYEVKEDESIGITCGIYDTPEKGGYISIKYSSDGDWEQFESGPQYGAFKETIEGKIPLSTTNEFQINHILTHYHSGLPNVVCDEASYHYFPPQEQKTFYYSMINHRVYENGDEKNVLSFCLADENYNLILDDIVQFIELKDPDGNFVEVTDLELNVLNWAPVFYRPDTSQWIYDYNDSDDIFIKLPDYSGNINVPLKEGSYELKVVDSYGGEYTKHIYVRTDLQVPIIESSSFKTKVDNSGNLICEWDVPYYIDSDLETNTRALLLAYKHSERKGFLQATIPTHMGRLFVPKHILDQIISIGDKTKLLVQIRTNRNDARSYSKTKLIGQLNKLNHISEQKYKKAVIKLLKPKSKD